MKIGGEFRDREPVRDYSLVARRCQFLLELSTLPPLSTLLSEVYPIYVTAREGTKGLPLDTDPVVRWWFHWSFEKAEWDQSTESPSLRRLCGAIHDWARRWGLECGWMLDVALDTLTANDHGLGDGHFAEPRGVVLVEQAPRFEFATPSGAGGRDSRQRLVDALEDRDRNRASIAVHAHFSRGPAFAYDPWIPQWQGRDEYRAEVIDAYERTRSDVNEAEWRQFEEDLDAYLNDRARAARARGLVPSPRTYADLATGVLALEDTELRVYRRLALSRSGLSAREIAAKERPETEDVARRAEAVKRSNQRLAAELGLPRLVARSRRTAL